MIYEAFIAPRETPNTARELKRALLTFDKVYIADPSDRDYFPPQAFFSALGLPPIFGMNCGPVRPLGKIANYEQDFDKLMDEVSIARKEGIIDLVTSYDLGTTSQATLGAVLLGGYPLNPNFLLAAYRNIARDQETLLAAIRSDTDLFDLPEEKSQPSQLATVVRMAVSTTTQLCRCSNVL